MSIREKIFQAALELAAERPVDQITFTDIAQAAGVHWTTVRRHLGSKQDMRAFLAEKQAELGQSNADTRTRLLDAATRVFAKYGYAEATLDQVAAEAGMTKGAVYWHFSGKSDLFLALCERSLVQQLQVLPNQAESVVSSSNRVDALSSWLLSQFEQCLEKPEKPMLFFEFLTCSRDPAIREKLSQTYNKMFDVTGAILQGLQARGLVADDVDPRALAIIFHSLVNGMIQTWLVDPASVQFDKLVHDVSRVLWFGLEPNRK
ncbi:TetR family transcriptional regulator [Effusibacillus pohliae]|uniref:TetR family transcriptional regulator n=1 Tax=Effusibacillus pohliae TaxID=232270 RepID=UPI00036E5BC1|nr:TetR family transcriptional regulator [Effusibacillus pohliae]